MSTAPAVSVEQRPDAVVVHVLVNDLDENNLVAVRRGIADAVKQSPSFPFILDIGKVKFVPSLSLGALVRLVNEFRARRQRLVLVSLQPAVRQVIAITRLDRIMEIMDDVDAALRSVGAGVGG
ncbi:MAG: STAS domain-containing protein [Bacillota bacterium]